ncbi:putative peptidoglycan lipid II flippase [Oceanospirillum multiglobuliferum]|uniref:Probable lipid II flippase MurJ n=1 Tax=Oceanospirillum multiglobuliferum TaxID=64969 RepID=A0A1T4LXJ6_9GAMM|nr:murein biosynthesis integral membrane protein MurJ [Oceanospirillum multiglobuliferum]OPX56323.1 murein biosynthesis integral membrane protein MurJ [Oceanospirillum multiglobuliferum]SJZ59361.1 putative peptidoglycan lipid II flippase [Oceanospirillum multiglobuliferum]
MSSTAQPSATPPTEPPKKSGLLRSGLLVSIMTLLSRVLGLARDIVIAGLFGAGSGADAFFVAFKIPNFLRRLFAEGAFNQAFVPVLSEYRSQRDKNAVQNLINYVAGTLGLTLTAITALAIVAAPVLVWVFAPGFSQSPEKQALTAELLQITFPYLLLISLTAFSGSILNSYDRFAVPAFTPVLLNLSLIGSALWLTPYMAEPVMALAWGVLIAGMAQLLFQLPFLAQIGFLPKPKVSWHDEGVKRILKLMAPALFGVSVSQINLLLDTVLASFLISGSVSWLYYSDRLVELPLGVFAIAIATVILPSLSTRHAEKSTEAFAKTLDWAVRMVLLIAVPAALALALLAEPLLYTLFQYGAMTPHDVDMAAMSLRAYAVGLIAFMLIKVLAPGYYARQDTKTPVKIGIKAMVANMIFNLMLVFWLDHAGLALATSLSAFLNAALLWYGLKKSGVFVWQQGWSKYLLQLLLSASSLVAVLLLFQPELSAWQGADWLQRGMWMAGLVGAGIAVFVLTLVLTGLRLRDIRH